MSLKVAPNTNTLAVNHKQRPSPMAKVIKGLIPVALAALWACQTVQAYRYISALGSFPVAHTATLLAATVHACCVYTSQAD